MHFYALLAMSPILPRKLGHFPSRQDISSTFLVAWGIVKHKETCFLVLGLCLGNISCHLCLLERIFSRKISIVCFAGLPTQTSLAIEFELYINGDLN